METVTGAQPGNPAAAVTGAWLRDWQALLNDGSVYLSGWPRRLLEVAASYATGQPVNLRQASSGLGSAHAGRLIEAVVIGTGMAEYYTVTGTAKLAGLRRWHGGLPGDAGVR